MSTRASAPRCASCGMPLAPDAESCAVCGARVPLIARPATGDDDVAGDDEATRGGLAARRASASPTASSGWERASGPTGASAPLPSGALAAPVRGAAFDAAAAARDVRAAARPVRPEPVRSAAVPAVGPRVLAYAIDVLVAAAAAGLGLVVVRATGGEAGVLPGLLGLLVGIAQVVAEGLTGATLGGRLLGLRTVDERTGGMPGVPRAFLRQLVVALGTPVCLVGNWVVAASAAWDSGPRRRGWHDKASGTTVVHAASSPAGRPGATRAARDAARPWTPTPPPAAAPTSGAARPALDDVLFAPPTPAGPVLPPPPVATASPAAPPVPDLLPAAPIAATDARPAATRPEADLLLPPPEPGRRERHAERTAAPAPAVPAPAAPPVAVPPAAALPVDPDLAELEHTRVRDPESLRRRTGTLALHFDTGERVRVVGRGLVGRGPRAEDGQDILHVVVLNDAARSLSRVHAEFGPQPGASVEDASIWVMDRGSTNGTVVIDPAGAARVLPAGTRAQVGPGWTVRLGDREARVEDD